MCKKGEQQDDIKEDIKEVVFLLQLLGYLCAMLKGDIGGGRNWLCFVPWTIDDFTATKRIVQDWHRCKIYKCNIYTHTYTHRRLRQTYKKTKEKYWESHEDREKQRHKVRKETKSTDRDADRKEQGERHIYLKPVTKWETEREIHRETQTKGEQNRGAVRETEKKPGFLFYIKFLFYLWYCSYNTVNDRVSGMQWSKAIKYTEHYSESSLSNTDLKKVI